MRWAALAAGFLASIPAQADGPNLPHAAVVLQGLDKVTARISELKADVDTPLRFGPSHCGQSAAWIGVIDARARTNVKISCWACMNSSPL